VTLSFWVRSSLTGQFGGALQNATQDRSYPYSYTISAANTWQYKTITIPGDTAGTWNTTNGRGAAVYFDLGMGSSLLGTAGAWAGSDFRGATGDVKLSETSGATFFVTGVQLEEGTAASPFENRLYGQELVLCQRYCIAYRQENEFSLISMVACANTTEAFGPIALPVQMRVSPSITYDSISNYRTTNVFANSNTLTNLTIGYSSNITPALRAFVASGLTAGQVRNLGFQNAALTSNLVFSAEL
jgi:hypothetical protein